MEETEMAFFIVGSYEFVGLSVFAIDPTPRKKRRLNSLGEDVYLFPDGSVKRDEDSIVAAQRIWRERAYLPGRGVMYLKGLERFNGALDHRPGQSESHTMLSEPCAS
jgi:hypothetical protein